MDDQDQNKQSDELKKEKKNDYYDYGIPPHTSEIDKKLFLSIKKRIHQYATRNSHEYIPLPMEYRASSIAYCPRKILLKKNPDLHIKDELVSEESKLDQPVEKPKELGHDDIKFGAHISGQIIHEAIQTALEKNVIGIEEEIEFKSPDFRLVGHYDLLMEDDDGDKIVIDIKSINTPREYLPVPSHLIQLMSYQGMLGGIKGAILYVNRNNWKMTFFPQEFDKTKFGYVLAKLTNLVYHEKNNSLPIIDPDILDVECKGQYFQCEFFDYCFLESDS